MSKKKRRPQARDEPVQKRSVAFIGQTGWESLECMGYSIKGHFKKIGSGSASGTQINFSKTLTGDVKYKSLLVVFGAGGQRSQVPTFSLSSGTYAKVGDWTNMVGTTGTNGAVMAYEVTDFKLPLNLSIHWDVGSNSMVKLITVYGIY